MDSRKKFQTIDEYIDSFSKDDREVLQQIRQVINKAVPEAKETISYQMPTFKLQRDLVHFAVNKNHIGFYPTPSAIKTFSDDLKPYKTSRGAIQFPKDKPIPFDLISKITVFRAVEEREKIKIGKG